MKTTESLNLEDHFAEIKEKVSDEKLENISSRRYELIAYLIDDILVNPHRKTLKNILSKSYLLHTEGYTEKSHVGLIIFVGSLKSYADKLLVPKLVKRVQSQQRKEVQFFKIKNPNSHSYHEIINTSLAIIENLVPSKNNPSEDEMNVNVLLNEILNFRQSTLSDEESWDHIAQQILRTTKKAPS